MDIHMWLSDIFHIFFCVHANKHVHCSYLYEIAHDPTKKLLVFDLNDVIMKQYIENLCIRLVRYFVLSLSNGLDNTRSTQILYLKLSNVVHRVTTEHTVYGLSV